MRLNVVPRAFQAGRFAAGVTVDGALFIAGGAVVSLLGDGGEVGGVIFRGHGYGAEEETGECGVLIEDFAALGVDVKEIEGRGGNPNFFGEAGFDVTEKEFEDGGFEGVKEKRDGRGAGQVEGEGVLLEEADGGEGRSGVVGSVGCEPVVEVELGDVGQGGVELDADDLVERELAGDEHCAAFACAEIDEGVVRDGVGWGGGAPEVDESAEDAGGDAVIGGDVGVVGVAGDEVAGGDEAAGVDAVDLVEGMLGRLGGGHDKRGFGFAWLRHVD